MLANAEKRRQEAAAAMIGRAKSGEVGPPPLDSTQRTALGAALRQHPALRQAWCVSASTTLDKARTYAGHVLIARLDPNAMTELTLTEDQCAQHVKLMLTHLTDAEALTCARTSFTTEGLPPALLQHLNSLPDSLLV